MRYILSRKVYHDFKWFTVSMEPHVWQLKLYRFCISLGIKLNEKRTLMSVAGIKLTKVVKTSLKNKVKNKIFRKKINKSLYKFIDFGDFIFYFLV